MYILCLVGPNTELGEFCLHVSFFPIKFFTWKDECDEAGGDGHGSKDEGGDDGADLGQGGHCR